MTLVAVFGPTASGKTAVAVALAERLGGEIVSCDAMQLYAGLPILTHQPTAGERARVPHHLIGVWPLDHSGSVAEYGPLAQRTIDAVLERGRPAIVAGGSGLYLRAALAGLDLPPQPRNGARERHQELYDRLGAEAAHARLAQFDPAAAAGVHQNDRRRVVRALELAEAGASLAPAADTLWAPEWRRPVRIFGLVADLGDLAARIAARTEAMFELGVEGEVAAATATELSATARRIHGLQDVRALLAGEIDRAEAIRRLTVRTRQYARRQRTWMRRIPELTPIDASSCPDAAAEAILACL